MKTLARLLFASCVSVVVPLLAQVATVPPSIQVLVPVGPTPTPVQANPGGVTRLMLGADISNGFVAPMPASRVRVPPGETVILSVPDGWSYPIQWIKNSTPIPGATAKSYGIVLANSTDSGQYNIIGAPSPIIATGIILDVVPAGHVGNFSARVELAPGTGTQTLGFVINGTVQKQLMIRAVGPTLSKFGVPKPAAQPRFRMFDARGSEIAFGHPALVIDEDALFASIGAFPLTGGERSFDYGPFAPGSYSIQVSDASGQGGTVLIETYEM